MTNKERLITAINKTKAEYTMRTIGYNESEVLVRLEEIEEEWDLVERIKSGLNSQLGNTIVSNLDIVKEKKKLTCVYNAFTKIHECDDLLESL